MELCKYETISSLFYVPQFSIHGQDMRIVQFYVGGYSFIQNIKTVFHFIEKNIFLNSNQVKDF